MTAQTKERKLVTITYFVTQMLGMNARQWYYHHRDTPGLPQRVYVAGKPMLIYDECKAFVDRAIAARRPRRHTGRPAKQVSPE